MTQGNETNFSSNDVAPNPFNGGGPDTGAIPTIPGFDMGSVAKRSPINVHGVMTLGILCIAAVAIWGMRSIGLRGQTGAMAAEVSKTMEFDTDKRAVMTVEDQRLLADLNASRTDHQVPGEELQKNPFSLSDAARPKPKSFPGAPAGPQTTEEEIRAARQHDLMNMLGEFKLQGVMDGKNAVARINGRAYRVGDTLGDRADKASPVASGGGGVKFVVTAVEGREVTVTAEGFSFILSMDAQ